jgi:dolichol-phosphate mannosyltransferase
VELHERLRACLEPEGVPLEIIFVDDGSVDGSGDVIRRLAEKDREVTGVELSRNFGQQAAVTAGLDLASGDWVVVMDADLQDRPEHIPTMLAKAREGYDMVYAIGRARLDAAWRRAAAKLFAALFRSVSRTKLPWQTGLFRVFNKRVLVAVRAFTERQRFVLGLLTWSGYKTCAMELSRDARRAGRSQFSVVRLLSLGTDALLSFSILPLRVALVLGAVCSLSGAGWAAFLVLRRITTDAGPLGMASILCTLLILGGLQLSVLGLVGEYVGRAYVEVQARPIYLVRELVGRIPRSAQDSNPVLAEALAVSRRS